MADGFSMGIICPSIVLVAGIVLALLWAIFGQTRLMRNGIPLRLVPSPNPSTDQTGRPGLNRTLTILPRRPPGTLPLAGNGINFLRDRQKLFDWFTKCEQLYGHETLQISVPSLPPGVIISDPRNLEYVFKNEGIFAKGEFFKRRSRDLFGQCCGLLPMDGIVSHKYRKRHYQC